MFCKNCGTTLSPDSEFCTTCGTPVVKEAPVAPVAPVAPAVNPMEAAKEKLTGVIPEVTKNVKAPKKKGNLACTLGVVFGILAIIGGIILMTSAGSSLSYASFGGDFYTYTYRGIRSIELLLITMVQGVGGLMSAFGAFMTCFFLNAKKK